MMIELNGLKTSERIKGWMNKKNQSVSKNSNQDMKPMSFLSLPQIKAESNQLIT
jgi:hypothetical protein